MAIVVPATYYGLPQSDFLGIVSDDSKPLADLGKMTNYLYANHTPPVVSCALTYDPAVTYLFILPAEFSVDNLNYEAYLQLYSATGPNTVRLTVLTPAVANAQPILGNFTTVWTQSTVLSAATKTFVQLGGAPMSNDPDGKFYLVEIRSVTGSTFHPYQIILRPKVETSIAAGIKASGFIPYDDGIIGQSGAPLHIELMNRIRRNVSCVIRDREQNVFMYAQTPVGPNFHSLKNYKYVHVPAAMPMQQGGLLRARIYAYDTVNGGKVRMGIEGGDFVEFTVNSNGNTYRWQESELRTQTDKPVFYVQGSAAGQLRLMSASFAFKPGI